MEAGRCRADNLVTALGVTHTFVSAVPDEGNPGEIEPSHWNALHTLDKTLEEIAAFVILDGPFVVSPQWSETLKDGPTASLSNGNATVTASTGTKVVLGGDTKTSGKWYAEIKIVALDTAGDTSEAGIGTSAVSAANFLGADAFGWGAAAYISGDNAIYNSVESPAFLFGSAPALDDIIMVALDIGGGKLWFGLNGVWNGGGDPATGANPTFTTSIIAGSYYLAASVGDSGAFTLQQTLSFAAPAGFSSWMTTAAISSGGTPGSPADSVQFNAAGTFAGDAGFTFTPAGGLVVDHVTITNSVAPTIEYLGPPAGAGTEGAIASNRMAQGNVPNDRYWEFVEASDSTNSFLALQFRSFDSGRGTFYPFFVSNSGAMGTGQFSALNFAGFTPDLFNIFCPAGALPTPTASGLTVYANIPRAIFGVSSAASPVNNLDAVQVLHMGGGDLGLAARGSNTTKIIFYASAGSTIAEVGRWDTTSLTLAGGILTATTTVGGLPAPGNAGTRRFVSDATATTFGSIVAGTGGNKVPVYDDGTNWRIG